MIYFLVWVVMLFNPEPNTHVYYKEFYTFKAAWKEKLEILSTFRHDPPMFWIRNYRYDRRDLFVMLDSFKIPHPHYRAKEKRVWQKVR